MAKYKKRPGKPGRQQFKPTDDQRKIVRAMSGYGIPQVDICTMIINPETAAPLSLHTLRLRFRAELDEGSVQATAKVAESLYKKAISDGPASVTAAIFWMKCRAGWRDVSTHEHTGTINFVDAIAAAAGLDGSSESDSDVEAPASQVRH